MTDRIDDLIQRLREWWAKPSGWAQGEAIIRQWAGEQQDDTNDRHWKLRAAEERQVAERAEEKVEQLRGFVEHQPGCPAQPGWSKTAPCTCGLTEVLSDLSTPQPVADGCDCGRHVDENGDQIHYSNCPLSNKPVAGEQEDSECSHPCSFNNPCAECAPYWQRMVSEGYWNGNGWTDKGMKEMMK